MNIETAERLIKIRKEKGYTQESLADALGLSRQAVSKWERAEASPDTDNLICLARLYGISLDELLNTDLSTEELKEGFKDDNEDNKQTVSIGIDGIHVIDEDGSKVSISKKGIFVEEANGENVYLSHNSLNVNGDTVIGSSRIEQLTFAIASTIALVLFIYTGIVYSAWYVNWTLFLLVPVISSVPLMIRKRRISFFNYPCLVTVIYIYLGFIYGLWHPYWILFISIPVFYLLVGEIDKIIHNKDD